MTIRSMLLATAAVVATSNFAYAADQQLSGTIMANSMVDWPLWDGRIINKSIYYKNFFNNQKLNNGASRFIPRSA